MMHCRTRCIVFSNDNVHDQRLFVIAHCTPIFLIQCSADDGYVNIRIFLLNGRKYFLIAFLPAFFVAFSAVVFNWNKHEIPALQNKKC